MSRSCRGVRTSGRRFRAGWVAPARSPFCGTDATCSLRSRMAPRPLLQLQSKRMIKTLEWTSQGVRFIDQTRLPTEEVYVTCRTCQEVAVAIRDMVVRGAPAIGVAAAMGIALGVKQSGAQE